MITKMSSHSLTFRFVVQYLLIHESSHLKLLVFVSNRIISSYYLLLSSRLFIKTCGGLIWILSKFPLLFCISLYIHILYIKVYIKNFAEVSSHHLFSSPGKYVLNMFT